MGWAPHFDASTRPDADALVFAFGGGRVIVTERGRVPRLEQLPAGLLDGSRPLRVGVLDGRACFAVEVGAAEPSVSLRELFAVAPEPVAAVAGRAAQTLEWDRAHAFCGRCGARTELAEAEFARVCGSCGAVYHPRIDPAVIMLVERGEKMLLARRPGRDTFSTLAGFVEAGETLEQAVVREVGEEVGLEVAAVRYFGSQAWPFPSQLMAGFFAEAAGDALRVDEAELVEARWFGPGEELPPVAPPFTIARRLIDDFLARRAGAA